MQPANSAVAQVNRTIVTLDLRWNKLGPVGGKAIAESLKVAFFSFSALFLHLVYAPVSRAIPKHARCNLPTQANVAVVSMDLGFNGIDDAAGEAVIAALQVCSAAPHTCNTQRKHHRIASADARTFCGPPNPSPSTLRAGSWFNITFRFHLRRAPPIQQFLPHRSRPSWR